jgi:hypothetical protein
MMPKTIHMCIDLRGALMNWRDSDWRLCVRENGKFLKPKEVKERFIDELAAGHKQIPVCESSECPNFDYSGGGCPGHEQ